MSDRLPGSSFSNPIRHRGWLIFADDCAGTQAMGYAFVHEDYDPTPVYADDGPSDHRHGWERTVDAAKAEIDAQEDDREDELRAATMSDKPEPIELDAEPAAAVAGPYWIQYAAGGERQICGRFGKILFRYPPDQDGLATAHCRRLQQGHAKAEARIRDAAPEMYEQAAFLCARLREHENELKDDEVARQFFGHVTPALARLESALAQASGK